MGEGFAGVDLNSALPDSGSTGNEISEPRGEESTAGVDPVSGQSQRNAGSQEARQSQATDLTDLDKLERFRFNGREISRKELNDSFMRHADYTRKTQEVAEARKYADNFDADMRTVMENPQLLEELKKVYPAGYVQIAEQILSHRQQQQPGQQPQPADQTKFSLPPEIMAKIDKVDKWEREMQERSTQATLEQLDSLHERLGSKYPYADPDVVDRRIELAIDKGLKIDKDNLSRVYENAYKMHNDAYKSRVDAQAKKKVEDQVKAGKQARDVGAGSSPPGNAPKKYGKFSEINKDVFSAFK